MASVQTAVSRTRFPITATVRKEIERIVDARIREAHVTREDFSELKNIVGELAAAQKRTEERVTRLEAAVERLAVAQVRTEQRVEELAEAQKRTEQRVEELAEAQKRTEFAVQNLARQVGGLSETVGGDIEDIAYIVLHDVLQREYGWKVEPLQRTWQSWDGQVQEVNVFGQARDPQRPQQTIWIVGEAKHNLTLKEVEKFAEQVEQARRNLAGEVFAVCFCYRARPEVQERIRQLGLRLVFSYGRLV